MKYPSKPLSLWNSHKPTNSNSKSKHAKGFLILKFCWIAYQDLNCMKYSKVVFFSHFQTNWNKYTPSTYNLHIKLTDSKRLSNFFLRTTLNVQHFLHCPMAIDQLISGLGVSVVLHFEDLLKWDCKTYYVGKFMNSLITDFKGEVPYI